jgi:hypothetical protein
VPTQTLVVPHLVVRATTGPVNDVIGAM